MTSKTVTVFLLAVMLAVSAVARAAPGSRTEVGAFGHSGPNGGAGGFSASRLGPNGGRPQLQNLGLGVGPNGGPARGPNDAGAHQRIYLQL